MAATAAQIQVARLEATGFKVCTGCKQMQPIGNFNFYLRKGVKRAFGVCRPCESIRHQNRDRPKLLAKESRRAARRSECHASPLPLRDGRSQIQAHHDDYSKPLDVRWLCQPCHRKWHKEHP